jgi:2-polyprenyl-3-methyl-5-hydroxy-6-metoxy-1,4-benzoquinol methylase
MDASESVIETARSLAKAKPAKYLSFEVGNIYGPHLPAENFDAIFAHQVLQHLRRPVDALRNSGRFWHLAGSSVFVMLIGEAQRFIRRTKEFAAS